MVSGEVTPDAFVLSKVTREITARTVTHKHRWHRPDPVGVRRASTRMLPPDRADAPSVSDGELLRLLELALQVERHYGQPMDLEWAIDASDGSVALLQARPETAWASRRTAEPVGAEDTCLRSRRGDVRRQGQDTHGESVMTLQPEDVDEILAILDSTAYDELTVHTPQVRPSAAPPRRWLDAGAGPAGSAASGRGDRADRAQFGRAGHGGGDPCPRGPRRCAGSDRRHVLPRAEAGRRPVRRGRRQVEPTTVVAILETMKLMTSVSAGVAGTVAQICLGNTEFAEAGTTLMWIEPS